VEKLNDKDIYADQFLILFWITSSEECSMKFLKWSYTSINANSTLLARLVFAFGNTKLLLTWNWKTTTVYN